ncbi:hypothetical protein WJX72_006533 [[Myrmecia] bisecta]|uniref:Transmembrane and coiled-coil domain-containing protein 4 n=1 Tax=[Myrmecia] bisecta TaxID=41462 RepID=A0AAW1QS36_9CHLO
MELSDADKFCTASLFTLALHTTQVEHGVGWEPGSNPWGVPAAKEDALFQGTGSLPAGLDDSQWDAFWGFDCCGPGGLCEQDAMKVAQAKQSASVSGAAPEGAAQAASPEEASEGKPRTPNVRWYDARARVALQRLAAWLHVPWGKLAMYECLLAEQAQPPEVTEDTGKKELTFAEKRNKYLKIGAAAVGGGTLLAVTGGLAAPALAAVTGSVLAAGGGAAAAGAVTGFMGSSIGAATLIAGLGAGGGYAIGGKMAHRIGDVKEFGFREVPDDGDSKSHFSENLDAPAEPGEAQHSAAGGEQQPAQGAGRAAEHAHQDSKASSWLPWSSKKPKETEEPLLPIPVAPARPDAPRLALTIGVSGWIADKQDCITMWQHAAVADCERFGLVWETEPLIALNGALMKFIKSKATQEAGKYMVEHFLVHGLMAAVALPMTVLSASNFIDSNWAVVMDRSVKVGVLLAHVLMSGAHGDRPVTLMGYSIGARVIYHCLLELCRCNCKGIVEHAVLLGTPENLVAERWALARSVVAGRLVNGFCSTDWVLGLTFRSGSGFTQDVAGLRAVGVVGVEDVDLGAAGLISGHADYMAQMDAVLDMLGFNHA